MLSVVCWKWRPPVTGYRSTFGPENVNTLRRMVARHYLAPHRFICVTDDAAGIDPDVEVIPLWNDWADVPSPHGGKNPSCYRRLRAFHPEAAQWFGPRFVSIDLDVVVTGNLAPLWDRPDPFVAYGNTHPTTHYNGSMFMLNAGAHPGVWTEFNPHRSPHLSKTNGQFGSDQGWFSFKIGPGKPKWTKADGVYSFRNDMQQGKVRGLPADARLVIFHGKDDPWSPEVQRHHPWVREHYR